MKKRLIILIADILAVILAYGLALWLRFDMRYSKIPDQYLTGYMYYAVLACVITVASYSVAKLYRSVWQALPELPFLYPLPECRFPFIW